MFEKLKETKRKKEEERVKARMDILQEKLRDEVIKTLVEGDNNTFIRNALQENKKLFYDGRELPAVEQELFSIVVKTILRFSYDNGI